MDLEALCASKEVWEVVNYGKTFIVNLKDRTCTCREWDLTEVPCVNACAAIINEGKDAFDHVHDYYTVETYKKIYAGVLMPVPDKSQWIYSGLPEIGPPKNRRLHGRQKKTTNKGFR